MIVKPHAGLGTRATYRVDDRATTSRRSPAPSAGRAAPGRGVRARARAHVRDGDDPRHAGLALGHALLPVAARGARDAVDPVRVLLPREDDDPTWTQFHPTNGAALAALFGDAATTTAAGTALTHMEWFLREDGTSLVNEVGVRPPGVHIMPMMGITHEHRHVRRLGRLMALEEFTPKPRTLRRRRGVLPRAAPRQAQAHASSRSRASSAPSRNAATRSS